MTDPTKTGRLDASVTIATVCGLRVNTHAVHARAATYSPSPNRDKPWPMAKSQKLRLESRELSFRVMSASSPHSLAAHRPQYGFLRSLWRNDIASPLPSAICARDFTLVVVCPVTTGTPSRGDCSCR